MCPADTPCSRGARTSAIACAAAFGTGWANASVPGRSPLAQPNSTCEINIAPRQWIAGRKIAGRPSAINEIPVRYRYPHGRPSEAHSFEGESLALGNGARTDQAHACADIAIFRNWNWGRPDRAPAIANLRYNGRKVGQRGCTYQVLLDPVRVEVDAF